ncbi:MAG: hypothetical protein EU533_04370 [Promethearchaeota archaeon]|nr:MAG: hypothetical protein EU533_04370 [Candidatus Lokiarchaeota archaeon]
MDLKKDYREFYKHWLKEINNKEITNFSEEEYTKITDLLNSIKELTLNDKNSIKSKLVEAYDNNLSYMLKDYLSVRKLKIINSAMIMEEINLDNLTEPEKLFYQNLVSSFKGFQKMSSPSNLRNSTKLKNLPQVEITSRSESNQSEQIDSGVKMVSDVSPSNINESDVSEVEMDYKYTLIRILKETPELVGYDLNVYGPFYKEDVVNIPEKNAIILVNEKFAERFEIS